MKTSARLSLRQDNVLDFLDKFGIEADPIHELDEFLLACQQVNPRYQGNRDLVRFQLETDESTWDDSTIRAIMKLAKSWGMTHGDTMFSDFDGNVIVALGGARRSPLLRALYAILATLDRKAYANLIIVAGSLRQLLDAEKLVTQDFAPDAQTEYDLCVGARNMLLARYPHIKIETVCEDDPKSGNDGVIKAVMRACENRLATQYGFNASKMSFAGVTTQIYVRALDFDLARNAKIYGWSDYAAAGHCSDPEMVAKRTVATYLSECLTTLRKAALAAAEGC